MEKECTICKGPLNQAHLGINACRACAVFYRRAVRSAGGLKCKRADGNCMKLNPQSNCRKCRLRKIEDVLKQAGSDSEPINGGDEVLEERPGSAGTSASINCERLHSECGLLMERLKVQYRAMSHTRMITEMHLRGDTPHPQRLNLDKPPAFPATVSSVQTGNKIFLSSALEFANNTFPEIKNLAEKETWDVITEFFYRMKMFEGCYRANDLFPDMPDRYMPNYTTYFGHENYGNISNDHPASADLKGGWSYITDCNYMSTHASSGREYITRVKPSHEEYLAVIGLMFWSIEDLPFRQNVSDLAELYTKQIMSWLHYYYRKTMKMEDYATRLGELLMLIQVFDLKDRFKENIEMLRLLNIYDDDTFVYRLQKE